jgi:hypothetical protein
LVRHSFTYKGENVTFTPDAYGQYFTPENGVHFFIEADRGTMTPGQFQAKVSRYAKFYASGEYQKSYPTFPLILTVTTTWERAKQLCQTVAAADKTDLRWLFTTFDLLHEQPLQSIWLEKGLDNPVSFLA